MRLREDRMVRPCPNSLIVRPIRILGPLNAAWSKNVFHSLRCLNSRVTSKKSVQTGSSGTQFGGLCCNGAMAPTKNVVQRSWWAVYIFLVESLVQETSREFQIGVATSWLPWLAWLAWPLRIVWMTSLLSTEKTTIFSGWLVCLLWLGCSRLKKSSSVTSSSHSWCNIRFITDTVWPSNTFNFTRQSVKVVLESGHLHPAMAGKLWGPFGFSCTPMFGRFRRAKLRPFSRRQHEHRRFWLNHQLTSALKWWLEILSCSPPRVVPTNLSERSRIVSYSDGEGSEAGVGVALWENETQVVRAGVFRVPEEVRILWNRQKNLGRFNDIFEIEAVGPLVLLENFPDRFRGSLWLHFLDNAAALSNLVNGSSSVIQGDILIGATLSQLQRLQVFPWFDCVDSKSTPVAGLSRGRLDGP